MHYRVTSKQYKWSYVCGPSPVPLLGLTIGNAIERADHLFGDREAVVSIHQNRRITFSQLKEQVSPFQRSFLFLSYMIIVHMIIDNRFLIGF